MDSENAKPDPLIGETFGGKYKILEKIGSGGMGGVYRAEHLLMNRIVALKVIRSNLLGDDVLLKRFHHEAKAASQISHPNAVTLFDYGVEGGNPFLVMEYIHGCTLKEVIASEESLDLPRVRNILKQICEALHAAHKLGIVHRDIKPDNFMIRFGDGDEEIVKVLDFGVAKSIGTADFTTDSNLTQVGTLIGTPQYMSPEQCQGLELDTRCDIYSVGVVVYEMLTGEVPFRAPSVLELLVKVMNQAPERITKFRPELKIPLAVDAAVMKALEKDRTKRFATILDFWREFEAAVPAPRGSQSAKGNFFSGALFALLFLFGVGAYLFIGKNTPPAELGLDERAAKQVAEAAAKKAEIEKFEALAKAEREKQELLQQAELDKALALRTQQEAAEKAEQEKQAALKAAEDAKLAAEKQAVEMKRMAEESERLKEEMEKQAEAQKIAAQRAKEEAEKKAEAEKQAEVAKQELQRLSEAAKRAEKEKAEMLQKMEEAKKNSSRSGEVMRSADDAAKAKAMENKLNESVRIANQQKAEAMQKVAEMKAEASRQAAAAKKAAEEAEKIRIEAEQKARAKEAQTPETAPTATEQPKARKRCGPSWCL